MAWERRSRGGRYYTRSFRQDGKVYRQYIGRGPHAEDLALLDELEQAGREAEREERRAEQEQFAAVAAAVEEYDAAVELLARAALYASGYHQPNRSQWRRRRE